MKFKFKKPFEVHDYRTRYIAGALLGGSVISGIGSIFGSNKAAKAQTEAANKAIDFQKQTYETNKNLLSPFITAGQGQLPGLQSWLDPTNASGPLNQLMKLVSGGPDQTATLEQTPGYQFNLSQGLRAATNALAARGLGGSGGAQAKGAATFASGLAGNTWQSVVNALQNAFTGGTGAMQNFVNTGVNAGGALAGAGNNTANAVQGALVGQGNAQAANANAIGGAIGGVGNALSTTALLNQLTSKTGSGYGGLYGSSGAWGAQDQVMNNSLFPGYGTG